MADISKVKTPDGNTYNVKDSTARDLIANKADKTVATTSANGLMSAADRSKLDSIGTGANVKSVNGKTGAVSLNKADVGLGNVDNTSDADKPYYKLIGYYDTLSNNVGNCKWNDASKSLYKIKNFFAISGEGDYFYLAHKKHDYTITATKQFIGVNNLFYSDLSSDCFVRTDLCSETDPAILTITRDRLITATDVLTLLFINHRGALGYSSRFNHWKLEILAGKSSEEWPNATVTWKTGDWITVFERTNVSDVPNGLYCCLNPYMKNHVSYIFIKGIRLTIYAATPSSQKPGDFGYNAVPIGRLLLLDSRPSFSPAEALGALDVAGGTVYGKTTFQEGISATSFSGASATSSADGLMSKADKAKLDGIGAGSNVKSVNGKTGAVTLAKGDVGLGSVANYDQSKAIKSITRSGTTFTATALDGTKTTFTQQDNNTTYGVATSSADGLMSKADKAKLDGIAAGAEKNAITGVKGSSESSYRTGNVNITKANIGLSNVDNTADNQKAVKSAVSATKDSQGQQINTTYIKELSALGNTITAVKGNGASSIFNIAGDDLYLFYRGVATGDLNELTTTGIYYVMSGGLANTGPSNIDITYCYLIIIGFAALKQQFILKPDSGMILMRSYLGQHTVVSQDDNLLDENSQPVLDESGNVVTATFKTPPEIASNSKAVWSRWFKINGIGV